MKLNASVNSSDPLKRNVDAGDRDHSAPSELQHPPCRDENRIRIALDYTPNVSPVRQTFQRWLTKRRWSFNRRSPLRNFSIARGAAGLLLAVICGGAVTSLKALELSPLFSDHMVVQRDKPIAVFGQGTPGEAIKVTLGNDAFAREGTTTVNSQGRFMVHLAPLPAGRDYVLVVMSAARALQFADVALGDVWVASGQSNMAWSMANSDDAQAEISRSLNRSIRLFNVPRNNSDFPAAELAGGRWLPGEPDHTAEFSAVAYHFGSRLQQELDVPIGLIGSYWGGTEIESWISQQRLLELDDPQRFQQQPLPLLENARATDHPMEQRINAVLEPFNQDRAPIHRINAFFRGHNLPIGASNLFNGMIHPLLDFPIKGFIWYQGESNANRAYEYRQIFPRLIEDWRAHWGADDLPFYFVQLANYRERNAAPTNSPWAELRDAQSAALTTPYTGMAVTIDIGDANDIHPRNKRDVGQRLARLALQQTYGFEHLVATGPVLASTAIDDDRVRLTFSHFGSGLVLREGTPSGFELADATGTFHWAEATLVDRSRLELQSAAVKAPRFVRYAWADNPPISLFNQEGLPASPFRTDTRPAMTLANRYQPLGDQETVQTYFSGMRKAAFLEAPDFITAGSIRLAVSAHDGQPPEQLLDGDLNTRWSASGLEQMVLIDLGKIQAIDQLQLAFYLGDQRQTILRIEQSKEMETWDEVFFGLSSGTTAERETISFPPQQARYLLLTFYGNTSSLWNSVTELSIDSL